VASGQLGHDAVRARFDAVSHSCMLEFVRRQWPEVRNRSVGQDDALFQDVVDGLAVDDRACAARVVRHHAAKGGAAGRRNIGCETQSVRSKGEIQVVEDDSRFDASPAVVEIDLENVIQILRRVQDEAGANRLPGL
jgi:hypothetical protein